MSQEATAAAPANSRRVPPGASCSSIAKTAQRLCRSRSWVWLQIQKNPEFPKTIKVGGGTLLLDHEVDAWLEKQASAPQAA